MSRWTLIHLIIGWYFCFIWVGVHESYRCTQYAVRMLLYEVFCEEFFSTPETSSTKGRQTHRFVGYLMPVLRIKQCQLSLFPSLFLIRNIAVLTISWCDYWRRLKLKFIHIFRRFRIVIKCLELSCRFSLTLWLVISYLMSPFFILLRLILISRFLAETAHIYPIKIIFRLIINYFLY